jgi:exodeoxyribonuclease-5
MKSQWTPQQDAALKAVDHWLKHSKQPLFRLFGFAGSGKSTLAEHIAAQSRGTVLFCAPTGKAAAVLRAKGCDGASTIHSLVYRPVFNDDKQLIGYALNEDSRARHARLVIVDEGSMVGRRMALDLLSFGTKILVLGDPGQLPPIDEEAGYFMRARPDIMLDEVVRQGKDSPVTALATHVRLGKPLYPGTFGDSRVISTRRLDLDTVLRADQILCGLNDTRQIYNAVARGIRLGARAPLPVVGDRVLCLRNLATKGFFNGRCGVVTSSGGLLEDGRVALKLRLDDTDSAVLARVPQEFFRDWASEGDLLSREPKADAFTFGWALTVHKAQGSEWRETIVFDEADELVEGMEGFGRDYAARWRYTAITRAKERATVALGPRPTRRDDRDDGEAFRGRRRHADN